VQDYDPKVPYPVANIIISSYAHPIIFALSLGSIFWGCICAIIVSNLTFSQSFVCLFNSEGSAFQIATTFLGV